MVRVRHCLFFPFPLPFLSLSFPFSCLFLYSSFSFSFPFSCPFSFPFSFPFSLSFSCRFPFLFLSLSFSFPFPFPFLLLSLSFSSPFPILSFPFLYYSFSFSLSSLMLWSQLLEKRWGKKPITSGKTIWKGPGFLQTPTWRISGPLVLALWSSNTAKTPMFDKFSKNGPCSAMSDCQKVIST